MDFSQLNFAALEGSPIKTKGILKGGEPFPRQVEVFLELLKDDGKTALLVGATAVFSHTIPYYPNSMMGCCATELEYVSGFAGLHQLAQKKPEEVAVILAKDPEFFETLGRFVTCTPEIAPERTGDEEKFVGSSYGLTAFPTPLQANVVINHIFSLGPLGLLNVLLTKAKSQKNAILKGLAQSKYAIELTYRLCEIALCRVIENEPSRRAALSILGVMSAEGAPTRALCFRTQMVDHALRAAQQPSNIRAAGPGTPATTARTVGNSGGTAAASTAAASSAAPAAAAAAAAARESAEPVYGDDDDEEDQEQVYEERVVKVALPSAKPLVVANPARPYDVAESEDGPAAVPAPGPHYDMAAMLSSLGGVTIDPSYNTADTEPIYPPGDALPADVAGLLAGLPSNGEGMKFDFPGLDGAAGLDDEFGFHDFES
eukprot:m.172495 g.172495  ORF g.172495 m.172495 type:complete len:430 (+) comp15299_c1_seq7:101-1390(+)